MSFWSEVYDELEYQGAVDRYDSGNDDFVYCQMVGATPLWPLTGRFEEYAYVHSSNAVEPRETYSQLELYGPLAQRVQRINAHLRMIQRHHDEPSPVASWPTIDYIIETITRHRFATELFGQSADNIHLASYIYKWKPTPDEVWPREADGAGCPLYHQPTDLSARYYASANRIFVEESDRPGNTRSQRVRHEILADALASVNVSLGRVAQDRMEGRHAIGRSIHQLSYPISIPTRQRFEDAALERAAGVVTSRDHAPVIPLFVTPPVGNIRADLRVVDILPGEEE